MEQTVRKNNTRNIVFTCIINIACIFFSWFKSPKSELLAYTLSITFLILYFVLFVAWFIDMKKWYNYEELEDLQCVNDNFANLILVAILQIIAVLTYVYVNNAELKLWACVVILGWCVFIILNLIVRYMSAEKIIPVYIKRSSELKEIQRKSLDSLVESMQIQKKYDKLVEEYENITKKYDSICKKVADINLQSEEYRIKAQLLQQKLKKANEEIDMLKSLNQNSKEE